MAESSELQALFLSKTRRDRTPSLIVQRIVQTAKDALIKNIRRSDDRSDTVTGSVALLQSERREAQNDILPHIRTLLNITDPGIVVTAVLTRRQGGCTCRTLECGQDHYYTALDVTMRRVAQ